MQQLPRPIATFLLSVPREPPHTPLHGVLGWMKSNSTLESNFYRMAPTPQCSAGYLVANSS